MKSFKIVLMQMILVVAVMVGVLSLLSFPEIHRDGKASIRHEDAASNNAATH